MVARAADAVVAGNEVGPLARLADRWIYVFMAGLFVVTTLAGFIPSSLDKLAAVDAGQRPPLPLILHVHAVLMGSWLILLLTQTSLVATGRSAHHRKLGLVAIVLVPALVAAMIGVTMSVWSRFASMPAGLVPPEVRAGLANLLLEQGRIIVLFPLVVGWALLMRKKDSEAHKRLLILATVLPLPAAIDRIDWLPTTIPDGPLALYLYQLVWLLPVLLYDVVRRGSVHRAYVIGIAANVPFILVTTYLWGAPWWVATAPRLMGVQGW